MSSEKWSISEENNPKKKAELEELEAGIADAIEEVVDSPYYAVVVVTPDGEHTVAFTNGARDYHTAEDSINLHRGLDSLLRQLTLQMLEEMFGATGLKHDCERSRDKKCECEDCKCKVSDKVKSMNKDEVFAEFEKWLANK